MSFEKAGIVFEALNTAAREREWQLAEELDGQSEDGASGEEEDAVEVPDEDAVCLSDEEANTTPISDPQALQAADSALELHPYKEEKISEDRVELARKTMALWPRPYERTWSAVLRRLTGGGDEHKDEHNNEDAVETPIVGSQTLDPEREVEDNATDTDTDAEDSIFGGDIFSDDETSYQPYEELVSQALGYTGTMPIPECMRRGHRYVLSVPVLH